MKIKLLLVLCAVMALSACLKVSDAPATPTTSIPFSGTDLVGTLAKEGSLQLFNKAFTRLSLAEEVTTDAGYTIFALTDSAMKAAGLDETAISQMDIDTLRKRISYQIITGALDDQALSQPVTAIYLYSLQKILVIKPDGGATYQYSPIYVKEGDQFYFNGVGVPKSGPVIAATNGYVYPVGALASALPGGTLVDVIKNDPDLSLYYQSLLWQDSLLMNDYYLPGDIQLFSNTAASGMYPAILAPTNKAFADAGFHTMEDIRNYAASTYEGYDPNDGVTFHFSPVDTVLKKHIMYNAALANAYYYTKTSVMIFYNDLLNPAFNNGKLNTNSAALGPFDAAINFRLPLTFSAVNGEAAVKYDDNPATAPFVMARKGAYVTGNGTLYKIDKLFYPIIN